MLKLTVRLSYVAYVTLIYKIDSFLAQVSTRLPGNFLYSVLIGWWLAIIYILLGFLMAISIVGMPYGS